MVIMIIKPKQYTFFYKKNKLKNINEAIKRSTQPSNWPECQIYPFLKEMINFNASMFLKVNVLFDRS